MDVENTEGEAGGPKGPSSSALVYLSAFSPLSWTTWS